MSLKNEPVSVEIESRVPEQLRDIHVQLFRGGLAFKGRLFHATRGSRGTKKKKKNGPAILGTSLIRKRPRRTILREHV